MTHRATGQNCGGDHDLLKLQYVVGADALGLRLTELFGQGSQVTVLNEIALRVDE